MPVNTDLQNSIKSVENTWYSIDVQNSKKIQCEKDKHELLSKITAINEKIKQLFSLISNQANDHKKLKSIVDDKVEKSEMKSFAQLITTLPTQPQVEAMQEQLNIMCDGFSKDNAKFKQDFENHMAIIRRYDEVLTTKASKISLFQLQEKIKRELEPELTLLKNGI